MFYKDGMGTMQVSISWWQFWNYQPILYFLNHLEGFPIFLVLHKDSAKEKLKASKSFKIGNVEHKLNTYHVPNCHVQFLKNAKELLQLKKKLSSYNYSERFSDTWQGQEPQPHSQWSCKPR